MSSDEHIALTSDPAFMISSNRIDGHPQDMTPYLPLSDVVQKPTPRYQARGLDPTNNFALWQDCKSVLKLIEQYPARIFFHLGLLLVLVAAVVGISVVPVLLRTGYHQQHCSPGGDFDFNGDYNLWNTKHTFQITLGFGALSFAQVKAIDVVFDVVVGRGGQLVLAVICFEVFSRSLNYLLEQPGNSVSFEAFRTICFDSPSMMSPYRLVRHCNQLATWRSKALFLWMALASLYVVAFPTWVSAMSGYTPNVQPYFDDGRTKTPIGDETFQRAIYRISGTDRIDCTSTVNLQIPTHIVGSRHFSSISFDPDLNYEDCLRRPAKEMRGQFKPDCDLVLGISEYIGLYGYDSSRNISSQLNLHNQNLTCSVSAPTLFIDIFNTTIPKQFTVHDDIVTLNTSGIANQPYLYTITNGTEAYSIAQINNGAGHCDNQNTYQWGFSFLLVFWFLVITTIWILGMWVMWNDAYWNSRLDRAGKKLGFYRGVVILSHAIRKVVLTGPEKLASNDEIRTMLSENSSGGRISLQEFSPNELPPVRKQAFQQIKHQTPLLCGWTQTWKLFHWTRVLVFALAGLACFITPLALGTGYVGLLLFLSICSLLVVGITWLITAIMLLLVLPIFSRMWSRFPALEERLKPYTKQHWTWVICSLVTGFLALFYAAAMPMGSSERASNPWYFPFPYPSDLNKGYIFLDRRYLLLVSPHSRFYMEAIIFYTMVIFAGTFWLIAAIMLLTGLFGTLARWILQIYQAITRVRQNHTVTSSTVKAGPDLELKDRSLQNR